MREYLELHFVGGQLETKIKLLRNLEEHDGLSFFIKNRLHLTDIDSKPFTVELKNLYDLHHEVLIADEIRPFFQHIIEKKTTDQVVRLEKILFIKISELNDVITENQKSFISSLDRQTSFISRFPNQPELNSLYDIFFQNQQKTYLSLVNTLVSELKLTVQIEIQNENLMLDEFTFIEKEIPQIDILLEMIIEMKDEIGMMNRKIVEMTKYINSKIDKI